MFTPATPEASAAAPDWQPSRTVLVPPATDAAGAPALHWQVHGPLAADRPAVEAFVQTVYARRHGARVRQFAPTLVSMRDSDGLVAAAGYRSAAIGPLFLERYLDAPVEQGLAAETGLPAPARERIFEVGHLAASRAGEGRRLVLRLGPHLAAQGCEWVVGTLTDELRSLFLRLGITPLTLASADPARLGDAGAIADWGRYYEHRPMVLAGHLPQALERLGKRRVSA